MASPKFVSRPSPNVSLLSVVRGVQLAFLGAFRALQNPQLYSSRFTRRSINVIFWSLAFQLTLWTPFFVATRSLRLILSFSNSSALNVALQYLYYIQHNVLQIGGLLISSLRFFKPELDELFLVSLEFVDSVHNRKAEIPREYKKNLDIVAPKTPKTTYKPQSIFELVKYKYNNSSEFAGYVKRNLRASLVNMMVKFISRKWTIGAFAVRLMSLKNLNDQLGTVPALACFAVLNSVSRSYSIWLITTYWGSRNLIHDFLLPYFTRTRFSNADKKAWMSAREGVLLGFGIVFYQLIVQLPWLSLFAYGIGEASVAYLITKISDPPPHNPNMLINWTASQLVWSDASLHEVLNGVFTDTDEGFIPVPGSFLFGNIDSEEKDTFASQ
ncbi:hypothetical protein JA9_002528 [Meyerozyma sp. JA9]|nr:hypothetical protein JA9_002528 [Meyerozyma sp. JA9]